MFAGVMLKLAKCSAGTACRAFASPTNTRVAQAVIIALLLMIGGLAVADADAQIAYSSGEDPSPLADTSVYWSD